MELAVYDLGNKEVGKINLPVQFNEPVRPDLIKRAVLAVQSNKRQRYGAKPGAGMRSSSRVSHRRRKYRGVYGFGISRVPRKIHTRRGTRMHWVGARVPSTVGGRRAHPPKSAKIWVQKINIKERRKAIRSALAATVDAERVKVRGHMVESVYPMVLDDAIEAVKTTKELITVMKQLGFEKELERISKRKVRAGKGKMRGRKYAFKRGPLFVVSQACDLMKAARNLLGVDIATINTVNASILAPGTASGRLTLYTKSAIERLDKEKLFM